MLDNSWISSSPVEVYVQRACDPSLHEPNYAIHLELAEYIGHKKANTPREAAMAIARQVNHRNPHVSLLALALLQTLVQSLGYPFHLQISTKEFLNELVRRFPERPPPFPGPVMSKILEVIHEWRETICKESRWKEDLGNIRDMHRLLSYKGYRFRDLPRSSNYTSTSATANLKSPEELENEDREAQSAKLQELIRRGTPRDLQAAQELMKALAGAEPEKKPDYRSQTLAELDKVQSKVILLNDMLDNVDPARGEKFAKGDAYDQVANICRQARPKIQKWISDAETEDPESLDTFLSINDLINNVLDRYERYQRGDFTAAPAPEPSNPAGSNLIDLLDLDDFSSSQPSGSTAAAPTSTADDLSSLFGPGPGPTPSQPPQLTQLTQPAPPTYGAGAPPLNLFSPSPTLPHAHNNNMSNFGGMGGMGGIGGVGAFGQPSTQSQSQSPTPLGGIALAPTPVAGANPNASGRSPGGGAGIQHTNGQQQQQRQGQTAASANKDPFADLVDLF